VAIHGYSYSFRFNVPMKLFSLQGKPPNTSSHHKCKKFGMLPKFTLSFMKNY